MAYTDIDKPSDYFDTVLYTGDGTSDRTITTPFSPEFTWIKMRSGVDDNVLYDIVRQTSSGVGIRLKSNSTEAESDLGDYVNLISNGFKVDGGIYNNSGFTFASWNWLANGAGVSNTAGSITSTVSANTTSGFSVVGWTGNATAGATIGHGLGSAPSLILTKNRDFAYNWHLWTHAFSSYNDTIQLNTTAAIDTGTLLNNTAPTSSLITLGNSAVINASGENIIAYCFAPKKGFSAMGQYTGNNSNDGPFLYMGFKPAFVLIKATNTTQWWTLLDNKRDTYNVATLGISPNSSNSESTFNTDRGPHNMDFVSNGLKIRTDNSGINGTNSFIYMAFAENPFVTSTSIPTTAR